MDDSIFTIFIVFGCIWVVMGGVALTAFLKLNDQPIRFGKWGLLVALPIVIPLVGALIFAAIYH